MEEKSAKLEEYLRAHNAQYQAVEHAPVATAEEYNRALGCKVNEQAKVLLVKLKTPSGESYVIAAVPGHKRVDLEQIRKLTGASKARIADKDQLQKITGCQFGELHPFAGLVGLKLVLDKDFLNETKVYINAARLDYSIIMSPQALVNLEKPLLI